MDSVKYVDLGPVAQTAVRYHHRECSEQDFASQANSVLEIFGIE